MNIDNLLTPRFKIIADFPDNSYGEVGTILDRNWSKFPNDNETEKPIWSISDFPNLFKKLEWWEERKESDMPSYLKKIGYVDSFNNPVKDIYIKIRTHFTTNESDSRYKTILSFTSNDLKYGADSTYSGWEPATEEEYLNQFILEKYKEDKKNLIYLVINKMSETERKQWIYEHTDNDMIKNIIENMDDSAVTKELF